MIKIPKPKPIPLIVEPDIHDGSSSAILLTCSSQEAIGFVSSAGPEFGEIYESQHGKRVLIINDCYDRKEVIEYLRRAWVQYQELPEWGETIEMEERK